MVLFYYLWGIHVCYERTVITADRLEIYCLFRVAYSESNCVKGIVENVVKLLVLLEGNSEFFAFRIGYVNVCVASIVVFMVD